MRRQASPGTKWHKAQSKHLKFQEQHLAGPSASAEAAAGSANMA